MIFFTLTKTHLHSCPGGTKIILAGTKVIYTDSHRVTHKHTRTHTHILSTISLNSLKTQKEKETKKLDKKIKKELNFLNGFKEN